MIALEGFGSDPTPAPPPVDTPEQVAEKAHVAACRYTPTPNPYEPGTDQARQFDESFRQSRGEIAAAIRGTVLAGAALPFLSTLARQIPAHVAGEAIGRGGEFMIFVRLGVDQSNKGIPEMPVEHWIKLKRLVTDAMQGKTAPDYDFPIQRRVVEITGLFVRDMLGGVPVPELAEGESGGFEIDPQTAFHWTLASGPFLSEFPELPLD
jgi:hypothetical protein